MEDISIIWSRVLVCPVLLAFYIYLISNSTHINSNIVKSLGYSNPNRHNGHLGSVASHYRQQSA